MILYLLLAISPAIAPRLPQAPPVRCDPYADASKQAIAKHKTLIVFVNTPVRNITGVITCQVPVFENDRTPRIVVAKYEDSNLYRYAPYSYPPDTTDDRLLGKAVRPVAASFPCRT